MKTKFHCLFAVLALLAGVYQVDAQGTAFTYQGRLNNGASPTSGSYDMKFTLYATNLTCNAIAGPVTNSAIVVNNGVFTTTLDFGVGVFTGTNLWLDIFVRTNGSAAFTELSPRQPVTPVPYATTAESANNLPGLTVQQNTNGAPNIIGGSPNNFVSSGLVGATIGGGGAANTASGDDATVAGGNGNTASGEGSFAAGSQAHAGHNGSFVWADNNSSFNFSSTTANQFRVRATGGVAFVTAIDCSGNVMSGVHLLSGDAAWSSISDKNAKKNFEPVDGRTVLEKLVAIPVEKWNYKWEADTNTPHIGPMAQDFKGAFYPGRDDKSISTLEFDGVELAAIQGLNQKLNEKDTEIQELKQRLEVLEKIIHNQKSN